MPTHAPQKTKHARGVHGDPFVPIGVGIFHDGSSAYHPSVVDENVNLAQRPRLPGLDNADKGRT